METKSSNLSAITKATAKDWESWISILTAAHADELAHRQIAQLALSQMPDELTNPEWWAQSVAVAYEQHIGRRIPGQAQDGSFQGAISTTLTTDLDGALQRFQQAIADLAVFNSQQLTAQPAVSASQRWRYWKAGFSDGTKTQVDIGLKGDKVTLALNITKAKTPSEVSEWKSFWRQILAQTKD